jgi:hypothetical protein
MGHDHRRRRQLQGRREYFPGLDGGHVQSTHRYLFVADRLVATVEVEHREAFPLAGTKRLELKQGFARGADHGRRRVQGDVPPPGQLADGQQPAYLPRSKAMAASIEPELTRTSLQDGALVEQGPGRRLLQAPSAERLHQQAGFVAG